MQAKAIVAADARKAEVRQIEIGSPGEWDVRVELECSAISVGTESYSLSRANPEHPFVLGYAPVGRVVEAGAKAAARFKIGDRISYFAPSGPLKVAQGCGGHMSPALANVDPSTRDLEGNNTYVTKVPEGLSSERAAFAGISAVSCMGAQMPRTNVGDKVLVLGAGLIGQFAVQHFHLRGAEVAVSDLHDLRLGIARSGGADHLIHAGTQDVVQAVRELWPQGAHCIVDTTGIHKVIEQAAPACRFMGKFVFLGWCKGPAFDTQWFHGRVFEAYFPWTLEGRRVLSSWRLMQTGALKIDPLITHRFAVDDAPKAYEMIYGSPEKYCGILIDWRK